MLCCRSYLEYHWWIILSILSWISLMKSLPIQGLKADSKPDIMLFLKTLLILRNFIFLAVIERIVIQSYIFLKVSFSPLAHLRDKQWEIEHVDFHIWWWWRGIFWAKNFSWFYLASSHPKPTSTAKRRSSKVGEGASFKSPKKLWHTQKSWIGPTGGENLIF